MRISTKIALSVIVILILDTADSLAASRSSKLALIPDSAHILTLPDLEPAAGQIDTDPQATK